MTRYIVKRVLLAIASVFIICAITFFAMNAIPGGPFNSEKALSEATKQVLEQRYNLDKPVPVQFVLYLKNLLHGDFGVSLKTGRDIKGTLMDCFRVSARLGFTAAVFAVIGGIILGSLAALFRNGLIDRIIVFFTTLFTAMPSLHSSLRFTTTPSYAIHGQRASLFRASVSDTYTCLRSATTAKAF